MGGAILSSEKFREEILKPFLRHTGPCISPFNAWILSKGLETVSLRVNEQSKNAEKIVEFLSDHNKIVSVNFPFKKNHPQYYLAIKQLKLGGNVLHRVLLRKCMVFFAVLHFALCFPKEINGFRTFIPSLESKSSTKTYLSPECRPKITFCKKNQLN